METHKQVIQHDSEFSLTRVLLVIVQKTIKNHQKKKKNFSTPFNYRAVEFQWLMKSIVHTRTKFESIYIPYEGNNPITLKQLTIFTFINTDIQCLQFHMETHKQVIQHDPEFSLTRV